MAEPHNERPTKRRRVSNEESGSESDVGSDGSPSDELLARPSATSPNPVLAPPVIEGPSRIQKKSAIAKPSAPSPEAQNGVVENVPYSIQDSIDLNEKTSFLDLGVDPWLVQSLKHLSITHPTRIQKATIPQILAGSDCIGGSRTGSGKTIAFALPILHKWAREPSGIFGLVLTPTRELALQIFEQFQAIGGSQSIKCVLVTGGADMRTQAIELSKRPHIVVATPGRLAAHVEYSGRVRIFMWFERSEGSLTIRRIQCTV
jgi:ATP-dependent RNA helicase DDX49/DBP8